MSDAEPVRRPRAVRLPAEPQAKTSAPSRDEAVRSEPSRVDGLAVEFLPDVFASAAPLEPAERAVEVAQRRGLLRRSLFSWGGLLASALGGLVSLAVGLWVTNLVEGAYAHSPALGALGLGLAALAALAVLVMAGREWRAIGRQRHIARLHAAFAAAHAADDRGAARTLIADLVGIYAARAATAQARADVLALRTEIVDGRDLIDFAERALVVPLDAAVAAAIAQASRRVSAVTTLAPRAIIDVVFVLAQAVRLIRTIAELYGGRPGLLGFLKLARTVGTHLAITGGMATGDALLQQVVGHGIAAKVSARLGEGVLNGLLTARIGLSAMAVCRPMPFAAAKTPTLRRVVPFLFRGSGDKAGAEP